MGGDAVEALSGKNTGRYRTWLIVVLVTVVATGLLLCGGVAAWIGTSALRLGEDREEIRTKLDDFVRAMSQRDVDRAYSLMSTRAQRLVPRSQLEASVEGDAFVTWHNYIGLEVRGVRMNNRVHSNQDVPQGKVADVQGVVRYHGNHMGALRATLEREDGAWRVHGVNITVPPSKLRDLDLSRRMEQ